MGILAVLRLDSFSELVALAVGEKPHGTKPGHLERAHDADSSLVSFIAAALWYQAVDAADSTGFNRHHPASVPHHAMPLTHRLDPRVGIERREQSAHAVDDDQIERFIVKRQRRKARDRH